MRNAGVDPAYWRGSTANMDHRHHRATTSPTRFTLRRFPVRAMVAVAVASALAASPAVAQSEHEVLPTPASLTQVLSCQSRDALGTFAELLFLQYRPPAWMRPSKLPKALDGMIGLYGFAVEGNVSVFEEPVDHVYFMSDWVVALLPRRKRRAGDCCPEDDAGADRDHGTILPPCRSRNRADDRRVRADR